jgi:molybdopterin/thiamine biosynthesis adenylyltransferase
MSIKMNPEHETLPTASLASVKNIVLTGFGKITLLDLDTIDISNLNRQFLFKKKDVKQSKAMVCPRYC